MFQKLFSRRRGARKPVASPPANRAERRGRPAVEALEDRLLLASGANLITEVRNFYVTNELIAPGSHEVDDGCITPGAHRLMRFDFLTKNVGNQDLTVGRPQDHPEWFVWSESHHHYHLTKFNDFHLLDMAGREVVPGFKQAFCLEDLEQFDPHAPPRTHSYSCANQGISVGWADIYDASLPCQFLAIDGVADGDYQLVATTNARHRLPETDYTDNTVVVNLHIQGNNVTRNPTNVAGITAVDAAASYTWDQDRTQHVVYRGADRHIYELWFNGAWHRNDLTYATGAPLAASNPAGYTWNVDGTEHVVYRGVDGDIHELWLHLRDWNHNDLTVAAGAAKAASDPAGYTWDVDRTQHVVYRGTDSHVYELWFNGAWHRNDLTAATGASLAAGNPVGHTWGVDRTQHVVYRGQDGNIYELWFNGAWHRNNLTAVANS